MLRKFRIPRFPVALLLIVLAFLPAEVVGQIGVWTDVSPSGVNFGGPSGAQRVFVDPVRTSDMYSFVTDVGLLKSTDYGATWVQYGTHPFVPGRPWGGDIQHDLNRDPSTPPALVICSGYGQGGLWKSSDGGLTWIDIWSSRKAPGITSNDPYNATIDPFDVNHIVITFHDIIAVAGTTNGGLSWSALTQNAFSAYSDYCYFVNTGDPATTRTRMVCWTPTDNPNTYLSTDGGSTWKIVAAGMGHLHGAFQPFQDGPNGTYYAPCIGGMMRSTDLGESWANVSSGNNGGQNSQCVVVGTGTTLYMSETNQPWGFATSPRADGVHWTYGTDPIHALPSGISPSSTNGPAYGCTAFDGAHWVVVFNCQSAGIYRLIEPTGKPYLELSTSSIEADYFVGSDKAVKTAVVTAVNPNRSNPYNAAVTISNKAAWLSVTVNSIKPDSQVLTNTVDPASLPDIEAKYYDTVTVHAAGSDVLDMTYRVMVWVRQTPVLTTVAISPSQDTVAAGQSIQFAAIANDQYGLSLVPQPAFTWSATGGSVNSTGLFMAGGCIGSYTATAAVSTVQAHATVTVSSLNGALTAVATASSVDNGYSAQAMIDGVVGGLPGSASNEWSSHQEKAGAWAELQWASAITIDSVALWDRPNLDDQVLSGTLTFSDGSSVSVGTLPNDASAPWAQKISARSITWVKFTVNTVSSTTANVGLAEFAVYNSQTCTTAPAEQNMPKNMAPLDLTISTRGLKVNAPTGEVWHLDLFSLSGAKLARISGTGTSAIRLDKGNSARWFFAIARLTCASGAVVEKMVR